MHVLHVREECAVRTLSAQTKHRKMQLSYFCVATCTCTCNSYQEHEYMYMYMYVHT